MISDLFYESQIKQNSENLENSETHQIALWVEGTLLAIFDQLLSPSWTSWVSAITKNHKRACHGCTIKCRDLQ